MDKKSTDHFMKWTTKCTKFLLSFTVKIFFFFAFLLKHCIRINQWLNFNLNSTGEVQVIIILLTFSYKI